MAIPEVKALVFDTFGTVVDWRSSIIRQGEIFGRDRNLTGIDWTGLADQWRAGYAPSMDRVRRGEQEWTPLDKLHRQRLEELIPKFGLESLSEEDRDWLCRVWHRLDPWPDTVPGLRRLAQRYLLAPLSNGNVTLLANMAKRAGLPWDCIFASDIFKHYKPDPETYLGAVELLGMKPGEVMMVAAHNYDLQAAASHGLRTGYINRPTEYGPLQVKDFKATGDWDVIGESMEDIADAMGC